MRYTAFTDAKQAWVDRHIAAGLCIKCSERAASGHRECQKHIESSRRSKRKRRSQSQRRVDVIDQIDVKRQRLAEFQARWERNPDLIIERFDMLMRRIKA